MSNWVVTTGVGLGSIVLGAVLTLAMEREKRPRTKIYKTIRSIECPFSPKVWPPSDEKGPEPAILAKYWYLTAKNIGAREATSCLPRLFFIVPQDKRKIKHRFSRGHNRHSNITFTPQ